MSHQQYSWDGPEKALARRVAFEGIPRQIAATVLLPGWDDDTQRAGACADMGVAMGVIDPAMPLYAAEMDRRIAPLIERDLRKRFPALRFHTGQIAKMPITEPVGLVYLDLMGKPDIHLARWLEGTLSPRLITGAAVVVNMTTSIRHNHFMAAAERQYGQAPGLLRAVKSQIGHEDDGIATGVLVLLSSLPDHQFTIHKPHAYTNKNTGMVTFKFTGAVRAENGHNVPRHHSLSARPVRPPINQPSERNHYHAAC